MLLVNKQVVSTHQIQDFKKTVGNDKRFNAFLSLQLRLIKTYESNIKTSKNFGIITIR